MGNGHLIRVNSFAHERRSSRSENVSLTLLLQLRERPHATPTMPVVPMRFVTRSINVR
jgi:hypothetical protein